MTTRYRIQHGRRVYQTTSRHVAAEASREGARVTARTEGQP